MQRDEHRKWPTWLIITLGAVITVIAVIVIGSLHDSNGDRLLDGPMSAVLVGILGTIGTITALSLQKQGEIRHQVQNSHKVNFRDDMDGKHDELLEGLDGLRKDLRGMRYDIGRLGNTDLQMQSDLSQFRREFSSHVDWSQRQMSRIDDLEDTVDPRKS